MPIYRGFDVFEFDGGEDDDDDDLDYDEYNILIGWFLSISLCCLVGLVWLVVLVCRSGCRFRRRRLRRLSTC